MGKSELTEWVYDTIMGNLVQECSCSGVENLFAEGKRCADLYAQMLEAYWRLCERLSVQEDDDGEIMINSMMEIMRIVAYKMYEYGQTHAQDSS